jgi:hypothetical protein
MNVRVLGIIPVSFLFALQLYYRCNIVLKDSIVFDLLERPPNDVFFSLSFHEHRNFIHSLGSKFEVPSHYENPIP